MKKLFFIVTMALHSTLIFASAAMPWPGNSSRPSVSDKPICTPVPKPITPSIPTTSGNKTLTDGNIDVALQHLAIPLLFNIAEQQNELHQHNKPVRPRPVYDESHLQPSQQAIEHWNACGKTSVKSTTIVQSIYLQQKLLRPSTGQVRSWHECYDQAGNVNRIHPKTLNGQDLIGQYYPPTRSELESFISF